VAVAAEFQQVSASHAHAERRHIVPRAQGDPLAFPPMSSNITEIPIAHAASLASDGLPNAVRQTDAGQVAGALGPASEPVCECLPGPVLALVQAPSRRRPLPITYLAGLNSGRDFCVSPPIESDIDGGERNSTAGSHHRCSVPRQDGHPRQKIRAHQLQTLPRRALRPRHPRGHREGP